MTDLSFACPHCRQPLEVDGALRGRALACPGCGGRVVAPLHPTVTIGIRKSCLPGLSSSAARRSRANPRDVAVHVVVVLAALAAFGYVGLKLTGRLPPMGPLGTWFRPAPEAAGALTRAQWWARLDEHQLREPGRRVVGDVRQDDFLRAMGPPDRTVTTGERAVWEYVCRDGRIQVVLDADALKAFGKVVCSSVNEP